VRQIDKYNALSLTKNLRGTSISIDEDYTPEERQCKSLLRKKEIELRSADQSIKTKIFVRRNELNVYHPDKSTTVFCVKEGQVIEKQRSSQITSQQVSQGNQ